MYLWEERNDGSYGCVLARLFCCVWGCEGGLWCYGLWLCIQLLGDMQLCKDRCMYLLEDGIELG